MAYTLNEIGTTLQNQVTVGELKNQFDLINQNFKRLALADIASGDDGVPAQYLVYNFNALFTTPDNVVNDFTSSTLSNRVDEGVVPDDIKNQLAKDFEFYKNATGKTYKDYILECWSLYFGLEIGDSASDAKTTYGNKTWRPARGIIANSDITGTSIKAGDVVIYNGLVDSITTPNTQFVILSNFSKSICNTIQSQVTTETGANIQISDRTYRPNWVYDWFFAPTSEAQQIFRENFVEFNPGSISVACNVKKKKTTNTEYVLVDYVGSLPYLHVDARFRNENTGSYVNLEGDNATNLLNAVDCTCELISEPSTTGLSFGYSNAFPRIYFKDGQFYWKINNYNTGIPAQGAPGKDGKMPKLVVVSKLENTIYFKRKSAVDDPFANYDGLFGINAGIKDASEFVGQSLSISNDKINKNYYRIGGISGQSLFLTESRGGINNDVFRLMGGGGSSENNFEKYKQTYSHQLSGFKTSDIITTSSQYLRVWGEELEALHWDYTSCEEALRQYEGCPCIVVPDLIYRTTSQAATTFWISTIEIIDGCPVVYCSDSNKVEIQTTQESVLTNYMLGLDLYTEYDNASSILPGQYKARGYMLPIKGNAAHIIYSKKPEASAEGVGRTEIHIGSTSDYQNLSNGSGTLPDNEQASRLVIHEPIEIQLPNSQSDEFAFKSSSPIDCQYIVYNQLSYNADNLTLNLTIYYDLSTKMVSIIGRAQGTYIIENQHVKIAYSSTGWKRYIDKTSFTNEVNINIPHPIKIVFDNDIVGYILPDWFVIFDDDYPQLNTNFNCVFESIEEAASCRLYGSYGVSEPDIILNDLRGTDDQLFTTDIKNQYMSLWLIGYKNQEILWKHMLCNNDIKDRSLYKHYILIGTDQDKILKKGTDFTNITLQSNKKYESDFDQQIGITSYNIVSGKNPKDTNRFITTPRLLYDVKQQIWYNLPCIISKDSAQLNPMKDKYLADRIKLSFLSDIHNRNISWKIQGYDGSFTVNLPINLYLSAVNLSLTHGHNLILLTPDTSAIQAQQNTTNECIYLPNYAVFHGISNELSALGPTGRNVVNYFFDLFNPSKNISPSSIATQTLRIRALLYILMYCEILFSPMMPKRSETAIISPSLIFEDSDCYYSPKTPPNKQERLIGMLNVYKTYIRSRTVDDIKSDFDNQRNLTRPCIWSTPGIFSEALGKISTYMSGTQIQALYKLISSRVYSHLPLSTIMSLWNVYLAYLMIVHQYTCDECLSKICDSDNMLEFDNYIVTKITD